MHPSALLRAVDLSGSHVEGFRHWSGGPDLFHYVFVLIYIFQNVLVLGDETEFLLNLLRVVDLRAHLQDLVYLFVPVPDIGFLIPDLVVLVFGEDKGLEVFNFVFFM